jgi:hypothetical protein
MTPFDYLSKIILEDEINPPEAYSPEKEPFPDGNELESQLKCGLLLRQGCNADGPFMHPNNLPR